MPRRGDITYHGPGQLVAYPILNLKTYGYRFARYMDQLEEVIVRVLTHFGIDGRGDSSNRGVWVESEKIASIGVAIKRWVSFHGLALNYDTDLRFFELIHPCGLAGVNMTSIGKLLGIKVSRESVLEKLSFHFQEVFKRRWEERSLAEILSQEPLPQVRPIS